MAILVAMNLKSTRTPAIDRLAAEGIKFTDFYMASPVCSASRSAMMTGSYPQRVGITGVLFPGDDYGLNPDEISVARVLKNEGYATKIVGKWHLGDQPEFFAHTSRFLTAITACHTATTWADRLANQKNPNPVERPPLPLLRNEEVIQAQPDQASLTERYTEESVRFLRENKDNPFFFIFCAHACTRGLSTYHHVL